MSGFGGEAFLQNGCGQCPANVSQIQVDEKRSSEHPLRQFAGCYGYLASHYGEFDLFQAFRENLPGLISQAESTNALPEPVSQVEQQLETMWRTDRLEHGDCLSSDQLHMIHQLLEPILQNPSTHQDLQSSGALSDVSGLKAAVDQALAGKYRIRIKVVPAGELAGQTWSIPQHCSNCHFSIPKWQGECPHCRSTSPPNSLRKRKLRGDRPYWPIVKFLGREAAIQLADQYFN